MSEASAPGGAPVGIEESAHHADRILRSVPSFVWDGERLPIPVEDIVDTCFGLHVREVDDLTSAPGAARFRGGQPLSGLLLAGPGEIWVSSLEAHMWPPRKRFTIGHELGHWVMHRHGQETLFCRQTSVLSGDSPAETAPSDAPPAPDVELEANAFSAGLLMPPHLIEQRWAAVGDWKKLREEFDVSDKAICRRLREVVGVEVGTN